VENEYRSVGAKAGVAIAIIIFSIGVYWFLADYALFPADMDGDALRDRILLLGNWGPFAVISLMAVAIVLIPLPSAPIALAAGATIEIKGPSCGLPG
jgi:uncharacterized membrane protein YdjX (TVP38/TMEM64 family)